MFSSALELRDTEASDATYAYATTNATMPAAMTLPRKCLQRDGGASGTCDTVDLDKPSWPTQNVN